MICTWKMYSHPQSLRKLKLNLVKERPNQGQIDGHILLGHGISGYVIALDGNYVQKIFPSSGNPFMDEAKEKDRAIEIRIYKRLGDHPRVCKYIQDVKSGIVLERLGKNLRIYLQDLLQDGKPVGLHQAIEWSCQTAQGLAYIHSRKILHTDIGCHNLLLDQHNNLNFVTLLDPRSMAKSQLFAAMSVINRTPMTLHTPLPFVPKYLP
jgi:serine/threonine protein kinase